MTDECAPGRGLCCWLPTWAVVRKSLYGLGLACLAVLLVTKPADAQEIPDSLVTESDSIPSDSLRLADSLRAGADSLQVQTDTTETDSIPPPSILPTLEDPIPAGGESGIWEWNREQLLGARGQTLWELLSDIPGVLAIRGGDYGFPAAAFPVGYAGGALRLYWDGVEHLPLEGSVPDLARVPLSGLEKVRVVRRFSGLEVYLSRLVHSEVSPYSLIEAGTGDQDTNILRGTFSLPNSLRGKVAMAIERLDTQGRGGDRGAMTGGWLRYSLHRGDNAGLRIEARRFASERADSLILPTQVSRTDLTLQGNWRLRPGVVAQSWYTAASLIAGDSTGAPQIPSPLNPLDPTPPEPSQLADGFPFLPEDRRQFGAQLAAERGVLWGRGTARFNSGSGVPDRELTVEVSAVSERWGGGNLHLWNEAWEDDSGTGYDLRLWLSPIRYASFFVERGSGRRAVPFLNPIPVEPDSLDDGDSPMMDDTTMAMPDTLPPSARFTERTGTRFGLRARWRQVEVVGSRLTVEADSVWPTQLPTDRQRLVRPQLRRSAWEAMGSVPLWPRGMALRAQVQLWDAVDSTLTSSFYFPDHIYNASLSFHRTFLPTENFELWVDLGAQGRSPMTVPVEAIEEEEEGGDGVAGRARVLLADDDDEMAEPFVPAVVPFYQNWYFRLQMRIISVYIFATIENAVARPYNQDFPQRLLPGPRGLYGVRWTLWN